MLLENTHPNPVSSAVQDQVCQTCRQANDVRRMWLLQLIDWVSDRYHRRVLIRQLQNLNDHYLKDIGLERDEIVSYVKGISMSGKQDKNK